MYSPEYSHDDNHHHQEQQSAGAHSSHYPTDNSNMYPPAAADDPLLVRHHHQQLSRDGGAPPVLPTRLLNLTAGFASPVIKLTNQKRSSLPPGYKPGNLDVLCGRGKKNWQHLGNVHFRNVIRINVDRYIDAPTKNDKTLVVISIVDEIRAQGGRFLKDDLYGRWYDIGDAQARDKVGHSLRDQVTALNRQNPNKPAGRRAKKGAAAFSDAGSDEAEESEPFDEAMIDDLVEQAMDHNKMDHSLASITYEQAAATSSLPVVLERSGSFHSDGGNEIESRRHSLFSSSLVHSFTRRPSLLAFSFGSRDSARNRASTLVRGDVKASMSLESFRRSSNWDFLASLDDMDVDFLDEDLAHMEPLALDGSGGSLYNFRDSEVRSFAQI